MNNILKSAIRAGLIACAFLACAVRAQTNITTVGTYTNQPYYSVSNSLIVNAGVILSQDPELAAVYAHWGSNVYYYGTNYSGGSIVPGSTSRRYVTVSFQSYSTNAAAAGTNYVLIQQGTGVGDWTTACLLTNILTGLTTNSASTNVDFYGNTQLRVSATFTDETNYTSWNTVGFSTKPNW